MGGLNHLDIAAYTEQDQTGYQGYFVYQSGDFTEGLGIKVTRCSTGAELPVGVIVRGGEGAGSGNPLSVVVRVQGIAPVIVGAGGLTYNDWVGAGSGGIGEAKETDGDIAMGRCTRGQDTNGGIAEVYLNGPTTMSIPGE